jgi:hypothetical protein
VTWMNVMRSSRCRRFSSSHTLERRNGSSADSGSSPLRPAAQSREFAPASRPTPVPQAPFRPLQPASCHVGQMRIGRAKAPCRLQRVFETNRGMPPVEHDRGVRQRPEIPLHTNGSENDIRCHVTRRKVSAGTRSNIGRDCRDAFLSLAKTCDKLGIAIWDCLGSRSKVMGAAIIEPLDHCVRARLRPA